jgi:hypothetical protein
MKTFFLALASLSIISCQKDNDYVTDFPNTGKTFKVSEISNYLKYPVFSKNGKFYGGLNFVYNENNSFTEYDFKKAEILIGKPISALFECLSNEGTPYYTAEFLNTSFYFDNAKEPHILGKDISFRILDINKDGIACGISGSSPIVLATIINTKNNKSLILSNPYNVRETGRIITDPINNVFSVYGRSYNPVGDLKLCKWEIMIDEDGNMKEKSKTIIEGNNQVDIYNYSNNSIYGSINQNFVKISEDGTVYEYNDTSHSSPIKSQFLSNEISLNYKKYGVGMISITNEYRDAVFVNLKSKSITPIQDFIKDSLVISDQEKGVLNSIGGAFYFGANQQGNSIILSDGTKSIKLDLK